MKTTRAMVVCIVSALAFLGSICNNAEADSVVLLSRGGEHTLDSGYVGCPRLNNYSEVVWSKYLGGYTHGIFSNINGLVSSGLDRDPDINDHGEIIWRFGDGGQEANGIKSSRQGVIFTSTGQDPYYDTGRINNTGEIIASRDGGAQVWSSTRGNLPTYGWLDRQTEVNDHGEVVSRGYYGPTGNVLDIYSTKRGAITNNAIWKDNPDINNIGEIVWDQNNEIWSNLRGKIGSGTNPAINDLGEIVWSYRGDIYSTVRGQLTLGEANDLSPQIANNGDIAFVRTSSTPTPIPAAAWLLGSGLMGLVGFRRRLKL
jgi:hypothetical protein